MDGDRVYVLTSYLRLYCLRTDTGAVIWSRDFPAELGSIVISWENAASPLIVGDLILLNCNAVNQRLIAIRKSYGSTAWAKENDEMTHSTPVFSNLGGVPQVIFLTRAGLVSVVPETGNVLWRLAFTPSITATAASPLVVGEYVHAYAAYSAGTWMARVTVRQSSSPAG